MKKLIIQNLTNLPMDVVCKAATMVMQQGNRSLTFDVGQENYAAQATNRDGQDYITVVNSSVVDHEPETENKVVVVSENE